MSDPETDEPRGLSVTFEDSDERDPQGFEIEAAWPWLVRAGVGGESALWGRAMRDWSGVWILRGASTSSPGILPPIRAAQAREAASRGRWLELFAEGLAEGRRFPEPRGRWQLTPMKAATPGSPAAYVSPGPDALPGPAYCLGETLDRPALFEESWGINGSAIVVPLRRASEPDAARVKAWRKHAREGTLPPLLILDVGALDVNVLLDGHDRLRAALLEGVTPQLIALWRPTYDDVEDDPRYEGFRDGRADIVARYEKAQQEPWGDLVRDRLNRRLVGAFRARFWGAHSFARTRACSKGRWLEEVRGRLARLGREPHPILDIEG